MAFKLKSNERNLIRRYLIWCYKATKEDLDKVDRKFTQLRVDYYVSDQLTKGKSARGKNNDKKYAKLIGEFKEYIAQKEQSTVGAKYIGESRTRLDPHYEYLAQRLKAIEEAVSHFLGPKDVKSIQALYEQEMTSRILHAREHT